MFLWLCPGATKQHGSSGGGGALGDAGLDAGTRCSNARDVIAHFVCVSQSCYPAADGGDFAECVDCLAGH